jgi:F0F1-type ATP synthase assembly protein I
VTEKKQEERWTGLLRFVNLSLYLAGAVIIGVGSFYWLGRYLDERLQQNYVYTILGLIAGGGIAFYIILRRLLDMGKGKDWTRR